MKIKIVGLDPSLTNTGIAIGTYDTDTEDFAVDHVSLVVTQPDKTKKVRRNSDDLERCTEISQALYDHTKDGVVAVFSEVPTGAQSSRAAFAFGMVIGILAASFNARRKERSPILFQVLPQEVKLAIPGGSKVTSKDEIKAWAQERFPDVEWPRDRKGKITNASEHIADACAVILAGIKTTAFLNFVDGINTRESDNST